MESRGPKAAATLLPPVSEDGVRRDAAYDLTNMRLDSIELLPECAGRTSFPCRVTR